MAGLDSEVGACELPGWLPLVTGLGTEVGACELSGRLPVAVEAWTARAERTQRSHCLMPRVSPVPRPSNERQLRGRA